MKKSTGGTGAILALFLAAGLSACTGAQPAQDVNATPANNAEPASNTQKTYCPAQYVQTKVFDEKLMRFVEGGINAKSAKASNEKMLAAVGHSASYLKFAAGNGFGLEVPKSSESMLNEDETCLNEVGQKLHSDLTVVTNASGMKFKDAPSGAFNSGVDKSGNPVVAKTAGLRGDTNAIEYTLPDGSKVYMMTRCGNLVFPSQPKGVPTGKTDNPPKPKKPTPPKNDNPPPPTRLTPKSNDARDYAYPQGKRRVTSSGPVRSTPHKVQTSRPGGGGVVDKPSNKPGSESGVTAPGANPAPSTPRPTNPPEGGSPVNTPGSGGGPP